MSRLIIDTETYQITLETIPNKVPSFADKKPVSYTGPLNEENYEEAVEYFRELMEEDFVSQVQEVGAIATEHELDDSGKDSE